MPKLDEATINEILKIALDVKVYMRLADLEAEVEKLQKELTACRRDLSSLRAKVGEGEVIR